MKKQEKPMKQHNSTAIDGLLDAISPEEQYRIDRRMLIAVKIQAGIEKKGWKKLDLARALHVNNPSQITKWLSGTHNFTIDTLADIERVLGIRLLDTDAAPAPARGGRAAGTYRPPR